VSGPAAPLDAFVERYVSVWNESDAAERRRLIEALWAPDGANFTRSSEWRGHDALVERVRGSWEKWVRDGGCIFRPRHAAGHHGAARVVWEMVSAADGRVVSVGNELLVLAADGRIREDWQFVDPG
jgi:hypothetical protein